MEWEVITPENLEGFSDGLVERVLLLYRSDLKSDMASDLVENELEEI